MVISSGELVIMNGHRRLFQAPMNTKIPTATMIEHDSGGDAEGRDVR